MVGFSGMHYNDMGLAIDVDRACVVDVLVGFLEVNLRRTYA